VPFYVLVPINNFLNEFGRLGDQNLDFWVKKGWNP